MGRTDIRTASDDDALPPSPFVIAVVVSTRVPKLFDVPPSRGQGPSSFPLNVGWTEGLVSTEQRMKRERQQLCREKPGSCHLTS